MRDSFVLTFLLVFVLLIAVLVSLCLIQRKEIAHLERKRVSEAWHFPTFTQVKNGLIPPPPAIPLPDSN
jgi:hypothetical protein